MADIPFAVDISQPEPQTGGNIMWHVRGTTHEQFIANLRDLQARVPSLRTFVVFNTAEVRAELTGDSRAPRNITREPVAPPAPAAQLLEPPVCPLSGRSKVSQFYPGLYCPEKHEGRRCAWKHECSAQCQHREAA